MVVIERFHKEKIYVNIIGLTMKQMALLWEESRRGVLFIENYAFYLDFRALPGQKHCIMRMMLAKKHPCEHPFWIYIYIIFINMCKLNTYISCLSRIEKYFDV